MGKIPIFETPPVPTFTVRKIPFAQDGTPAHIKWLNRH